MNKLNTTFIAIGAVLAFAACGDNKTKPDSAEHIDGSHGGSADAAGFPAAPQLGAQIDRLGRPAINTALNGVLLPDGAAKTAQKDAYNQAADLTTWSMVQVAAGVSAKKEFQNNIGVFDVLDQGLAPAIANAGCGNAVGYTSPASATSYATLATFLVDDRLYVDTTLTDCSFYLSLEVEKATGGNVHHTACGGRTPTHDVIDTSYSLLTAGLQGFDAQFHPLIGDTVPAHGDITTTFPYLGPPHS